MNLIVRIFKENKKIKLKSLLYKLIRGSNQYFSLI